jgi:periplasmic protein TonB
MYVRSLLIACGFAAALVTAAPAQAQESVVYTVDQLTEVPKLVSPTRAADAVRDAFPAALRAKGVAGVAQVTFVVDADGKVDPASVKVLTASPTELATVAEKVVPKLEFRPGKKDGTAVRTKVRMPLSLR